jgi:carbamoyltransferase
MYVLGINSAYHESSASLLMDGRVVAAAEEERFNRVRHAKEARIDNPHELPWRAIGFCLAEGRIGLDEVDHAAFSLNPRKRLENRSLPEVVLPGGWGSPEGEETFHRNLRLVPGLLAERGFRGEFRWVDHPVCHAGSAFYASPFESAAVLSVDGIGETDSVAFFHGQGRRLHPLGEVSYPASLGFLWEKLSGFLGFSSYDAYKVMGLAAYGRADAFADRFGRLVKPGPKGSFELDNQVLRFRAEDFDGLEYALGVSRRRRDDELTQDIAAALQAATNRLMLHMMEHLHGETGSSDLCLAGGVALNCVANRAAFEAGPFDRLFVPPASHDAGTAVGAALYLWHEVLENGRSPAWEHPYLGPAFSADAIEVVLRARGVAYARVPDIESRAAELLCQGHTLGWFQDGMEFGPRALGNRSLLADPRDARVRDRLNGRTKLRELFRPLAPSVLCEEAEKWFRMQKPSSASDFMALAYPVREEVAERIPAVVHSDGTSRIQTVRKQTNPKFHRLISEFFALTGVPMLLNTSFNSQEPMVCTPQDALDTFLRTDLDFLAMDRFLVERPPG